MPARHPGGRSRPGDPNYLDYWGDGEREGADPQRGGSQPRRRPGEPYYQEGPWERGQDPNYDPWAESVSGYRDDSADRTPGPAGAQFNGSQPGPSADDRYYATGDQDRVNGGRSDGHPWPAGRDPHDNGEWAREGASGWTNGWVSEPEPHPGTPRYATGPVAADDGPKGWHAGSRPAPPASDPYYRGNRTQPGAGYPRGPGGQQAQPQNRYSNGSGGYANGHGGPGGANGWNGGHPAGLVPGERHPGERHPSDRHPGDRHPGDRRPGEEQARPKHRAAPTRAERYDTGGTPGLGRRGGRAPARGPGETFYYREETGAQPGLRAWETGELGAGLYERQMAGISALISLANDLADATRASRAAPAPAGSEGKQRRLAIISKLRSDEMTWNSLLLVINTALQSGSGFVFWIIAARLFSASDVGKGSALTSGVTLISGLALLGLNISMGKFLPAARNRDALISSSLVVVAVAGAVGAVIYILLTPVVATDLAFVERSPLLMISFVIVASALTVNTLTDNIFIALRKAKYTVIVDGVIGGFGKLALAFVLTGAGSYGIFLASSLGIVFATVASLLFIYVGMRVRLELKQPFQTLKPLIRFSGASYMGDIANVMTSLIVPIVLLDRLGPASAAYFFVVLQMAQIVYTAGLALEQTFLTEGSRADADLPQLKRRSLRLLTMFFIIAAVLMIGLGRWLLLAFGSAYYHNGYTSLVILVLAAGPVSANYWFQTLLRLAGKLRAVVTVNAIGCVAMVIGVWVGASHGLAAVAWGFLGSSILTASVAGISTRDGRARS